MTDTKQQTTSATPAAEPSAEIRELLAQLEAANAKIAAMGAKSLQSLTVKRSEKGAVSVYGLGRFPVTLYASQWDRLAAELPKVGAFIKANRSTLAAKS